MTEAEWEVAFAKLAALDGEDWDDEVERLDRVWEEDYRREFVAYALSRPGWKQAMAEEWASETSGEAALHSHGRSPMLVAQEDVRKIEWEAA